jgi:hypothetical protein
MACGAVGFARVRERRSACSSAHGVSRDARCGVSELGAGGPARRSRWVSRARRMGPPPIHSPRTAADHDRLTRSLRRIPAHRDARESWIRAWGPTRARPSRNRPLEEPGTIAGLAQGWAGHPGRARRVRLTLQGTPESNAWRAAAAHSLGKSESLPFVR